MIKARPPPWGERGRASGKGKAGGGYEVEGGEVGDGQEVSNNENATTDSQGTKADPHTNRLFICLPATESGAASVGPAGWLTSHFGEPRGYRSNRKLHRTVVR